MENYEYNLTTDATKENPVIEGQDAIITITRTRKNTNINNIETTVYITIASGSGIFSGADVNDWDIENNPIELTFGVNDTTKNVRIPIRVDLQDEEVESFTTHLYFTKREADSNEPDNIFQYEILRVYIKDNKNPLSLTNYNYTMTTNATKENPVIEGEDAIITITRTRKDTNIKKFETTVYIYTHIDSNRNDLDIGENETTADKNDYTPIIRKEITFGVNETKKNFKIPIKKDNIQEGINLIYVELRKDLPIEATDSDYIDYITVDSIDHLIKIYIKDEEEEKKEEKKPEEEEKEKEVVVDEIEAEKAAAELKDNVVPSTVQPTSFVPILTKNGPYSPDLKKKPGINFQSYKYTSGLVGTNSRDNYTLHTAPTATQPRDILGTINTRQPYIMHGAGKDNLTGFQNFAMGVWDDSYSVYGTEQSSSGGSMPLSLDGLIHGDESYNNFTIRYNGYLDMRYMKKGRYKFAFGADDTAYFIMDTAENSIAARAGLGWNEIYFNMKIPGIFPFDYVFGKQEGGEWTRLLITGPGITGYVALGDTKNGSPPVYTIQQVNSAVELEAAAESLADKKEKEVVDKPKDKEKKPEESEPKNEGLSLDLSKDESDFEIKIRQLKEAGKKFVEKMKKDLNDKSDKSDTSTKDQINETNDKIKKLTADVNGIANNNKKIIQTTNSLETNLDENIKNLSKQIKLSEQMLAKQKQLEESDVSLENSVNSLKEITTLSNKLIDLMNVNFALDIKSDTKEVFLMVGTTIRQPKIGLIEGETFTLTFNDVIKKVYLKQSGTGNEIYDKDVDEFIFWFQQGIGNNVLVKSIKSNTFKFVPSEGKGEDLTITDFKENNSFKYENNYQGFSLQKTIKPGKYELEFKLEGVENSYKFNLQVDKNILYYLYNHKTKEKIILCEDSDNKCIENLKKKGFSLLYQEEYGDTYTYPAIIRNRDGVVWDQSDDRKTQEGFTMYNTENPHTTGNTATKKIETKKT